MFLVKGVIRPETLGRTLTHEHLSMDFTHFYRKPPQMIADKFDYSFSLDTIGYIRQYPYSSKDNLTLNDQSAKDAVLRDIQDYKANGGGKSIK